MRLLVTGGCGFIGANFLRAWHEAHAKDELVNLDALTYAGNPANVKSLEGARTYRFIHGDITRPEDVRRAMQGCETIVHFAAESHVDRSITSPSTFVHTNVQGTAVLLDEARRADVGRFHHVSTDEVFGDLPLESKERFGPDSPYRPSSPYAASKAAADHLVRAYGRTYGVPFTITNGSNNFGPYQHPEKVIPRFITNQLLGQKMPVYGDGRNVRDWLHVADYCHAIELVLQKGRPGHTYCVGGGNELDNLTLARAIAKAFGRGDDAIEFVKDRKGHDLRYAVDSTKIQTELGWRPKAPFATALADTIGWYRRETAWWQPLRTPPATTPGT